MPSKVASLPGLLLLLASLWVRHFRRSIARISWLLVAVLGFLTVVPAPVAQNRGDEVHVAPRATPSTTPRSPDELKTHIRPFTVNVDLVLVPVTVTDPMGRLVLGLTRENFQLYEDRQLQTVQHFSSGDVPISLGFVFDASGSMAGGKKMEEAREAVTRFLMMANPQDEIFMITFSNKPQMSCDFTNSFEEIEGQLAQVEPQNSTALLDAIYLGLSKMRHAKHSRKALLVISDGGDNSSRYTEAEVKSLVKEADTLIYALGIYGYAFGIYGRFLLTPEERTGPTLLKEITEATGGRTFRVGRSNDLPEVASKIGLELRNQYVLGYRPNSPANDSKWHKIKVRLLSPRGMPSLHVYAKKGYYAASP